ncbi:MAG: PPOX class F420-dependent oxidoreductase [Deltaproteobacteria bacterium]|nr:PPOX class F420-dependent oxidoreductase [Deltaproteobacteria bacterium]
MVRNCHWQMVRRELLFTVLALLIPSLATAADTTPSQAGQAIFSEKEVAYIKAQRVARLATVSNKHQPDVAPVSFEFDGTTFFVGGRNNPATMKYRNVKRGNGRIAIVFDDWESLTPWKPRSIKIHGTAELVKRTGLLGEGEYLRITPIVKWSMGVNEPAFQDGKAVIKKIVIQPAQATP